MNYSKQNEEFYKIGQIEPEPEPEPEPQDAEQRLIF